jgi:hypothetical protein
MTTNVRCEVANTLVDRYAGSSAPEPRRRGLLAFERSMGREVPSHGESEREKAQVLEGVECGVWSGGILE